MAEGLKVEEISRLKGLSENCHCERAQRLGNLLNCEITSAQKVVCLVMMFILYFSDSLRRAES